jgi:membrane-associated protease RseP (regulator of RpoE activity)
MTLILAICLTLAPLVFHEMGHWAMLKRYDVPVLRYWAGLGPTLISLGSLDVKLLPIGGAVVPEPVAYQSLCPQKKQLVALAGPFASILFGLFLLLMYHVYPDVHGAESLRMLADLNFVLAGINLLPIPPLDGYHFVMNWLASRGTFVSDKVNSYAARAGNGLVYGIGFFIAGSLLFK